MASQSTPAEVRALTPDGLWEIAWETACQACVRAALVLLFGSIALGIVGGIFKEMIPSWPPGVGNRSQAEATSTEQARSAPKNHASFSIVGKPSFILTAGVFFVAGMWRRLSGRSESSGGSPTRAQKVVNRLTEDWFGLVVGNAFGAMFSAMVVSWAQQISWTQMCCHWVAEAIGTGLDPLSRSVFGARLVDAVEQLSAWYGANQFRFAFWVFYLAAIADDLGLPNFKTAGRWLGRKVRHHRQAQVAPPA